MRKPEDKQVMNGEPIVKKVGYKIIEICCDCGLSHAVFYRTDVKNHKQVVIKTSYRDDYETNKERRRNE